MSSRKEVKPCILKALTMGNQGDMRSRIGHMIVSELRGLHNSSATIVGCMSTWNLRNSPVLPKDELKRIISMAQGNEYNYGCLSEAIRNLLGCIDPDTCQYYQKYHKQSVKENTETEKGGENEEEKLSVPSDQKSYKTPGS